MTMVVANQATPPPTEPAPAYAGLVTRTIAFALDVAIIDFAALLTGVIVGLALSPFNLPANVTKAFVLIAGALTLLWGIGYLAWFWSSSGQTPGDRVLGLRVISASTGETISFKRGVVRVFALALSALLFCIGFLMILFDSRRRALHDRIVRTVVVYHDWKDPRT